jgi:hypothetical protein
VCEGKHSIGEEGGDAETVEGGRIPCSDGGDAGCEQLD